MIPSDHDPLSRSARPQFGPSDSKTIAGGVIVLTAGRHYVQITVQGGPGSGNDDLDTITGGIEGDLLVICPSTSGGADTVTAKDGTGNLLLAGDFAMDNVLDRLTLLRTAAVWVELARSSNA